MIVLYHCTNSRSMRSLWLLNELNIEFKLNTMPFEQKYLRTPEYLKIHPLGRVPCLIDEDITLFETGAICQYLCEKYDDKDLLGRSKNSTDRIYWLQWLHFAETIAVHGANLAQQNIVINEELRSPTVIKLEGLRLEKALEVINLHFSEKDYMLGCKFSSVDTAIGYSVHLAKSFQDISALRNLERYYKNISKRPAFTRSLV